MSNKFLDALDELEKKEAGGGIICNFHLGTGYKLFVSGLSNTESFFAYDAADENSRNAALAKAKKALGENGGSGRPQSCVVLILRKATVKGRDVTWKEDRVFAFPLWTDGYKKVLKPKLAEMNMGAGDYWGRIGFVADPSGRKKKDQNGVEQDELVAFPAELYANEGEAAAAAGVEGGAAAAASNGNIPSGWDDKTWSSVLPDFRKMQAAGKSPAEIAASYAVEVKYVALALAA